jgi:hypothetical protein
VPAASRAAQKKLPGRREARPGKSEPTVTLELPLPPVNRHSGATGNPSPQHTPSLPARAGQVVRLTVRLGGPDGPERKFQGRVAWALAALIAAGDRGISTIEQPAPRWSDYVHKLRRAGVVVETIAERHGGPYAGEHGRYVLRSAVAVVGQERAA